MTDSGSATLSWVLSIPKQVLIGAVKAYRYLLSPWLQTGCRYEPTCSAYSLHALEQHGAAAGTYLTLRRLARCHPLCEGGHDPVPECAPALFQRWIDRNARAPTANTSTSSVNHTSP